LVQCLGVFFRLASLTLTMRTYLGKSFVGLYAYTQS
jgi:hypothetical protein